LPQVIVSNEFFKKERDNYTNWRFCFWRELLQNSIDAGSTVINISLKDMFNKTYSTLVTFDDNGTGFDANVRDNIFFNLGRTNKGQEGDIGGFGKARVLVCFSQNNYQIISQDWRVTGEGGSYDIHSNSYYKGCNVIVDVDAEIDDMHTALYQYLQLSQLNCDVYVNGDKWDKWCHRRRYTDSLSFGRIYVNKSGGNHSGYLIVRVDGVPMFTRYIGIKPQIVVEIDADKSREVLLSNRDMLKQDYQTELDTLIKKLSTETKTGLRKSTKKWITSPGRSRVTVRKRNLVKENSVPLEMDNKIIYADLSHKDKYASKDKIGMKMFGPEKMKFIPMPPVDDTVLSSIILLETDNPKVRKVFPRYDVNKWGEGGNRKKLLRQWTIVCNFAIQELLKHKEKETLTWRPGFVFSDYAAAKHVSFSDNIFLLNPVDKDGKIVYGLRDKKSWTKMIILACHEVAHVEEGYHDESFVSLSEHLIQEVLYKRDEVFRSLKDSLKTVTV